MAKCDTCDGTGDVCALCGYTEEECECATWEPADCIDCDGTGEE